MPLPVANREYLISRFNHGDIPTEQDFILLINSAINTNEDNLKKELNSPLQIGNTSTDALQKMIEFFRGAVSGNAVAAWSIGLSAGANRPGFAVMQGSANRLFIQEGTGNVGIGNDDPRMSLQASSNSLYSSPAIGGYKGGTNNHNGWLYMHVVSNANSDHAIIWDDKRSLRFGVETNMGVGQGFRNLARITHEGRIGIGTDNPAYTLDIQKNTGAWLSRFNHTTQGSQVFLCGGDTGNGAAIYVGNNGSTQNYALWVGKGGNPEIPYLFVRGDGNVGVGTNNPEYKLDVYLDKSSLSKIGVGQNLFRVYFNQTANPDSAVINNHNVLLVRGYANSAKIGINYTEAEMDQRASGTPSLFLKGRAHASGAWDSPNGDYADLFESETGKDMLEGVSVVIGKNGKIRKAKKSEVPIGITTKSPAYLGNSYYDWPQKYLKDEFGNILYDDIQTGEYDELGEPIIFRQEKLNPDYDPAQVYIPRIDRPEWHAVGLIGRLHLRKGQPVAPTWVKIKDVSENVELWLVK